MSNKSIADDPSQWTTPVRENNIPKSAVQRKSLFDTLPQQTHGQAPTWGSPIQHHTMGDYHTLRQALNTIMNNTASAGVRRACREALENTPSDGFPI